MKNWLKFGLSWGLIMALLTIFVTPYLFNQTLTYQAIISKAVLWLIVGVGVGYVMKHYRLINFSDEPDE